MPIVEKMLELAELGPNELLYDLGSGDGRIVIMAAQRFGARAVGIDYDPKLCHLARTTIQQLGLSDQARIIENDILEEDWSPADVVTIQLEPYGIEKLKPSLERFAHHGMRIVVHRDDVPGWTPTASIVINDEDRKAHELRLYKISRPGDWTSFSKFGRKP